MIRSFRVRLGTALTTLALAGGVLASGGCQQVIGTKERRLNPQVTADAACRKYCDTIMANCTGENAQYVSNRVCLADCSHLPQVLGNPMSGNSVQCRQTYAESAASGEPGVDCYTAGPVGGSQCGTICDAYCTLITPICPMAFTNFADCSDKCPSMKPLHGYNTSATYQRGNTVQCRFFHLSAATQTPTSHCPHAGLESTNYCTDTDVELESGSDCAIEPDADDCDRCEATKCCKEKSDCYNDAICGTADDDLDACADLAESMDAGTAACHASFAATNSYALAIDNCKRANCSTECDLEPLTP